jgi:hypothetical protein
MNNKSFEKWQAIEDEFLNSDLDEVAFCKSRKINLDWFRQKLCDAERHEQKIKHQKPGESSENLFVELIPQLADNTEQVIPGYLKVKFRDADFELTPGFPVEVFRQAIQVVKEVI